VKDYLIDTNILGYFAELRAGVDNENTKLIKQHLNDETKSIKKIFLCPISIGEVKYGLRVGPYKKVEHCESINKILLAFPCLEIDRNIAYEKYSELRSKLFNKFAPKSKKNNKAEKKRISEWFNPIKDKDLQVDENDVWIAAVAMTYNLILVSHDKMNAIKKIVGADLQFEDWLS
jgi:predicted nucleic acid-binding protein